MYINFSQALKSERKARGLSQYELADILGVTRGAVSNYEQGVTEPSLELLVTIVDFFGVTSDKMLGRTE